MDSTGKGMASMRKAATNLKKIASGTINTITVTKRTGSATAQAVISTCFIMVKERVGEAAERRTVTPPRIAGR